MIDQNQVRMTGENSFLRLGEAPDTPFACESSHWRVVLSPLGRGHALFHKDVITGGEPRIYADNVALARWLQEGLVASMRDTYAGPLPIIEATFAQSGDAIRAWTERITSRDSELVLTWYDFAAPIIIANPAGGESQPHGVYSILVPARRAQLTVNGAAVPGTPQPAQIEGAESSSCCLALAETWTIPRDHAWAADALG